MVKYSTTKTVMIFYVDKGKVPIEFIEWLQGQIKREGLSVREAAAKAHVSHPTLLEIINNGKKT